MHAFILCGTVAKRPAVYEGERPARFGIRGGSKYISTYDFQAAYSVTDKFAIALNYLSASGGDKSSKNWGKGSLFEGGAGYYKPFAHNLVFEAFGGISAGGQLHKYYTNYQPLFGGERVIYRGTSNLAFSAVYLQPAIGITYDHFEIAFSTRVSNVHFHQVTKKKETGEPDFGDLDAIAKTPNSILMEPAITIRGGWKHIKAQAQLVSTANVSNPKLAFEKSKFCIGLTFAFADCFRD